MWIIFARGCYFNASNFQGINQSVIGSISAVVPAVCMKTAMYDKDTGKALCPICIVFTFTCQVAILGFRGQFDYGLPLALGTSTVIRCFRGR